MPEPARNSAADGAEPAGESSGTATRASGAKRRRRTVLRVLLATTLVLALVVGITLTVLWRQLNDNLDIGAALDDALSARPSKVAVEGPKEPLNVLVMGSDSREGAGNNIDGLTGMGERSDTTILLHLSADRTRAYGISIPRDSMVDRPKCETGEGTLPPDDYVMWNEAFSLGGYTCTMQQFEQLTGIRLDHYVVLNFQGFKDMVDAIDGVEVCIPETVDDRAHGIYLEAGVRTVRGREALNYVRVRSVISDNADIGRMKRQQAFVASMANKVVSADTLARPDRLIRFLSAATKSLKVDPGLRDIAKLAGLGLQFQDIGLDQIKFLTIPFATDPADPNRLVWAPEAEAVWQKIANDEPLGKRLAVGAISADKAPGATTKGSEKTPSPDELKADEHGLCA